MTVTVTDFKAKCFAMIDEVQKTGQPLIISKYGRNVVRLVPEVTEKPWKCLAGRGKFIGAPFAPTIDKNDIKALR